MILTIYPLQRCYSAAAKATSTTVSIMGRDAIADVATDGIAEATRAATTADARATRAVADAVVDNAIERAIAALLRAQPSSIASSRKRQCCRPCYPHDYHL